MFESGFMGDYFLLLICTLMFPKMSIEKGPWEWGRGGRVKDMVQCGKGVPKDVVLKVGSGNH